jgi:hypothetical protein
MLYYKIKYLLGKLNTGKTVIKNIMFYGLEHIILRRKQNKIGSENIFLEKIGNIMERQNSK